MFEDRSIVTFRHHSEWMRREILEDRSRFFIGQIRGKDAGYVRYERASHSKDFSNKLAQTSNIWLVSIALLPTFRGRGFGAILHQTVQDEFLNQTRERPLSLLTWAKSSNQASWRIFEKSGWQYEVLPGFGTVISLQLE